MTTRSMGILISGSLWLAACGGESSKMATPTPATNNQAAAVSTTTTSTGSAGSLPADFPKDVPVYTGATVVSGATTGAGSGAVLSTADATEKVAAFYKDELAKNGWTTPQTVDTAGTTNFSAMKEKRQLGISIAKGQDGKTMISIGITAMP